MLGEILGISDIPLSTNAFMPKIIINAVNNKCHHKKIIVAENTQNNAVFPRLIIEFKRSLFLQNPNQFEYWNCLIILSILARLKTPHRDIQQLHQAFLVN